MDIAGGPQNSRDFGTPISSPLTRQGRNNSADPRASDARVVIENLDRVSINWRDFENAARASRELAKRIGLDRATLRALVYGIESSPALLKLCEKHQLLNYLVLYDGLDRGFRIRLHVSTNYHLDRPHDHRFSFSSYIVRGKYRHTWYGNSAALYGNESDAVRKKYYDQAHVDPAGPAMQGTFRASLIREETEGNCYTIHHSVIHSTVTTDDTVSVFVRSPAEKPYSVIYDSDTARLWWRFGRQDETPERRQEKEMSLNDYYAIRDRLEKLQVI